MNEEATPAQVRAWEEKRELLRIANARLIENHESGARLADPLALHHARLFLKLNPPLNRPLGTGNPEESK